MWGNGAHNRVSHDIHRRNFSRHCLSRESRTESATPISARSDEKAERNGAGEKKFRLRVLGEEGPDFRYRRRATEIGISSLRAATTQSRPIIRSPARDNATSKTTNYSDRTSD